MSVGDSVVFDPSSHLGGEPSRAEGCIAEIRNDGEMICVESSQYLGVRFWIFSKDLVSI